ncbi:hypothetical protein KP806_22090 [Paenibacillus sp. N4]|uniref:hypothetical protein n=1 Tax=Paenibacillus vietnamensis TaxID=2590547 RepID=UPI001CD120C1|nr:hypothetical protein [Paenibacillus vietnamensis]MCA0757757.1 hypothetical protein [Paenibacillus vietnamensis]
MKRTLLVFLIFVVGFGLLIGCSNQSKKGDYIIGKEQNGNVSMILVAKNISEKESKKKKTISDYRKDETDLMYYHVEDPNLYEDLNVGERVSVEPKMFEMDGQKLYHVMDSDPPQVVAGKITRY